MSLRTISFKILFLTFSVLSFNASFVFAVEFDHAYKQYDQLLKGHLKDGLVNYKSIKKQPQLLNGYLGLLSKVDQLTFNKWSEDERLAFLINLYNAATIKLVADNYPIKSIKDIDKEGEGPWKLELVNLFGKKISLDHLEHEIIRKNYKEPRIHFALVCAAIGCPKLPNESFIASKLVQQFDERTKLFLSEQDKNSIDKDQKVVYLSSIFNWFASDFENHSGSVIGFVKKYFPAEISKELNSSYTIKFTEYDWNLNDVTK